MNINRNNTALLLIGYQNDYFAKDGILREAVEESLNVTGTLKNTVNLLDEIIGDICVISTPIIFTADYSELVDPVGILKTIKDVEAFKADSFGSKTIEELASYKDKILEVPGKLGLNAFINTNLDEILKSKDIKNVILAGCVSSICIDSTGRSAFEKGYKVGILSDCTSGRSAYEQQFYCDSIFPLYGKLLSSQELVTTLKN
jgi:nicotinamidase-related amidase